PRPLWSTDSAYLSRVTSVPPPRPVASATLAAYSWAASTSRPRQAARMSGAWRRDPAPGTRSMVASSAASPAARVSSPVSTRTADWKRRAYPVVMRRCSGGLSRAPRSRKCLGRPVPRSWRPQLLVELGVVRATDVHGGLEPIAPVQVGAFVLLEADEVDH